MLHHIWAKKRYVCDRHQSSCKYCTEGKSFAGKKLELGVLLRRAVDICRGVQEVHGMGIILRDLKPVCCANAV